LSEPRRRRILRSVTTASDALAAAAAGREALADGPIRVRMGLRTGEPTLTEEGYVGIETILRHPVRPRDP
jgi:hypothetical protein